MSKWKNLIRKRPTQRTILDFKEQQMIAEKTQNGQIESSRLGFLDNGCFTFTLTLDFDGAGQGFGGIVLGKSNTYNVVSGILKALKLEKWEDLEGTYVRVVRDAKNERIVRIGHIKDDSWFDLQIRRS